MNQSYLNLWNALYTSSNESFIETENLKNLVVGMWSSDDNQCRKCNHMFLQLPESAEKENSEQKTHIDCGST